MAEKSNFILRPLSPADVEQIKGWPKYSEEFAPLDYALRSGGWLDTFPDSPTTIRFGGWLIGNLVGFSLLTDMTADSAEFYIALHPAETGRGIGCRLTEETLKFAFNEFQLRKVYLKVRKWHARGIKLYNQVGFVISGEKKEEIQGNAVEFYVMEKVHMRTERKRCQEPFSG